MADEHQSRGLFDLGRRIVSFLDRFGEGGQDGSLYGGLGFVA